MEPFIHANNDYQPPVSFTKQSEKNTKVNFPVSNIILRQIIILII